MAEIQTHAAEISDQFEEHLDLSTDQVAERLDKLVGEYKLPLDEAKRSVRNSYMNEAGIERDDMASGGGENDEVLVNTIDQDEQWVDITVKVVDLWEPRSDSISQVGLVGDESGRTKFVSFTTSELPLLEEGKSYQLENVVTDEYKGDYSVKLNRTTEITELEEDVEVGDSNVTVTGSLVDIQSGSGLIKRCPHEDCTRVLKNKRCSEHGDVEGEFDLRIKAVFDDGNEVRDVIFNKEATVELTGITLEDAKQKAMEAVDTSVVAEEMREDLVGRYFTVTGPELGRYLLGNEFAESRSVENADELLIKARSL